MFSCLSSQLFTGLMILSVLLSMWPDTSWQIPSSHRLTSLNFYFLVIYCKDIPPFPNRPAKGFEGFGGGRSPTFPFDSAGKESTWNAGDLRLIPAWVGMIPWKGKGYPLQYSGLGNSKECIVHGVTKSRTWLSICHFSLKFILCRVFSSIVEDFSGHLVFHITRNGSHHICDILFVFS